jgi:hypothetical protein
MVKVPDNELLPMWKKSKSKEDNSYNDSFSFNYFAKTNILELKNCIIVSSRRLNNEEYISMTYKNLKDKDYSHIMYCLVILNIDNNYPPEKSRICSYCTISDDIFDFVNTIVTYKTNQMLNLLNKAIDEKFTHLMNHNFNVLRYRIGKSDIQNILVKPDRAGFNIPSLSSIMSDYAREDGEYSIHDINHDMNHDINRNTNWDTQDNIHHKDMIFFTEKKHGVTVIGNPVIEKTNPVIREKNPVIDKSKLYDSKLVVNKIPPEVLFKKSEDTEVPFMTTEMSEQLEDSKIESLLESLSTNIQPRQKRNKQFIF